MQKAKERYSKEKATEYYLENKEAIKKSDQYKKSRDRYKNLSGKWHGDPLFLNLIFTYFLLMNNSGKFKELSLTSFYWALPLYPPINTQSHPPTPIDT